MEAVCDTKGRIVLPKAVRETYGTKFVVVPAAGEIVLMPIPENPLAKLAALGRKAGISDKPLKELREGILKQAKKDLHVRGH